MRRMVLSVFLAVSVVSPTMAQMSAGLELTPDQKGYIAYDQCIMHAAIQASKTDAKDEEIFGLAKAQCAATRAKIVVGQESNRQYLAALDAADADKAANFPKWIKGVRERRKAFDVQGPAPTSSPRQ